jgi:molecular chaperone DnaJ
MKNYYNILGLSKDASADEIKKAYRKLSKQYHPDVNPEGEEKFKDIAEAYDVLSDPQKKQMVDMGQDPNSKNNFGGFGDVNIDDFLKNMGFGGNPFANGGGSFRRKPTAPDKIITIEISPIESYLAPSKDVKYQRNCSCKSCNGTGGDKQTCGTCNGGGYITQRVGSGFLQQIIQSECPACRGKGFYIIKACFDCQGSGAKGEIKTINININHGIDDGEYYRLENAGDFHNGTYGNLLIKVQILKDPLWEKLGDDLIYHNFVNYKGLSDSSFEIPHPDGKLSIKYPEQFDTSTPLRLKGKGYKRERVGDLYVKSVVKFKREEIPNQ